MSADDWKIGPLKGGKLVEVTGFVLPDGKGGEVFVPIEVFEANRKRLEEEALVKEKG